MGDRMSIVISARRGPGNTYAAFYRGRKVFDLVGPRAALEWLSEQIRRDGHVLSRHSDLTGADIAAYRAGRVVVVDGARWRTNEAVFVTCARERCETPGECALRGACQITNEGGEI